MTSAQSLDQLRKQLDKKTDEMLEAEHQLTVAILQVDDINEIFLQQGHNLPLTTAKILGYLQHIQLYRAPQLQRNFHRARYEHTDSFADYVRLRDCVCPLSYEEYHENHINKKTEEIEKVCCRCISYLFYCA